VVYNTAAINRSSHRYSGWCQRDRTINHELRDQRRHALAAEGSDEDVVPVPRTCSVVEEQPGLVSVGVELNVRRRSLELDVAGRLADGSRATPVAGLVICCESRSAAAIATVAAAAANSGVTYFFRFLDMAALLNVLVPLRREVATKAL